MSIETTSAPLGGGISAPPVRDERLQTASFLIRAMRRPELGAIGGLVIVGIFFALTANSSMFTLSGGLTIMNPSAQLGIMAVTVSLLMIGGEFDLSIGSMVAFSGLVFGVFLLEWHLPLIVSIAGTLAVAAVVGAINGQVVRATKLPSFIVTLAFFFILRGLSLVGLKIVTGGTTQLRGFTEATADSIFTPLFSGFAFSGIFRWLSHVGIVALLPDGTPAAPGIPIAVVWFVLFTGMATWCLLKTKVGNWIFASGGDARSARNSGVPVDRVKTGLFILTACSAAFVGILTVMDAGSTDAMRGLQKEFQAVIAAVIGGCLLTGGYGSALGAFFGSIIFGIVSIGLSYTTFDSDWFQVFLGAMLLIAVIFNNHLRRKVTGER